MPISCNPAENEASIVEVMPKQGLSPRKIPVNLALSIWSNWSMLNKNILAKRTDHEHM